MSNAKPLFDPATHHPIELRGRVDVEGPQSFDSSAKISVDETGQMELITVLKVHTDQSWIVGLVRRLPGLGITILQLQIVPEARDAAI